MENSQFSENEDEGKRSRIPTIVQNTLESEFSRTNWCLKFWSKAIKELMTWLCTMS